MRPGFSVTLQMGNGMAACRNLMNITGRGVNERFYDTVEETVFNVDPVWTISCPLNKVHICALADFQTK